MGAIETNAGPNLSVRTFSQTKHLAKSKNFYEDLEIPRTATQTEIKSAYYELSKAYHPDKNKSEQAKIKFRLISEAYEVLGNVRTRRMYDKGLLNGHQCCNSKIIVYFLSLRSMHCKQWNR